MQRLAEAYPASPKFANEAALCLVDEVDTYLHPKWQQSVLSAMTRNFPNTQFIITTHSPLIISSTPDTKTIILRDNDSFSPPSAYGKDHNTVLYEYMDVKMRVKEILDKFDRLYNLIDDDKKEEAEKLIKNLVDQVGAMDPEIVRTQILINFM